MGIIEILLVACVLIWVPILINQIQERGLLVLLAWLFIAPVAVNMIEKPGENPFFKTPARQEHAAAAATGGIEYATAETKVTLRDLLEPTRLLFGTFLVVVLLGTIINRARPMPLDRAEIWMCVFSVILLASALFQSRRLAFGLHVSGDSFMVPFLSYFVARRLVTNEDRFRRLIRVLTYTGLYVIVFCLAERLIHARMLHRVSGPFHSQSHLFIFLTVAFYAAFEAKDLIPRNVRSFVLYLAPVVTLLTWVRGNWIGLLAGAWVYMFLGRKLLGSSRKMGTIGLTLLFIALLGAGVSELRSREFFEERVANPDTWNWRLARWEIALREGASNPIFGIGLNNLRDVYGKELRTYFTAHNSFVSFFAELGAAGLLAYLAIVASIARMGMRLYRLGPQSRDRWRGAAVLAVMAAYQVGAAAITYLYVYELSHIYVFVFVGAVAGLYTQNGLHPARATPPKKYQVIHA